jgi:hypothetical protein
MTEEKLKKSAAFQQPARVLNAADAERQNLPADFSAKEYSIAISAIDTSHCPADFQVAWIRFESALSANSSNTVATAIMDLRHVASSYGVACDSFSHDFAAR